MKSEQINQVVNDIITNIAQKLGIAAEHVYPILLKQAYIEGFTKLFLIVVGIALLIYLLIKLEPFIKALNTPSDNYLVLLTMIKWAVGAIIFFIDFIAMVGQIPSMLTALFNPNYYIIMEILKQIKG